MSQCENHKTLSLRQRGALLLDSILAVAVIGSVLGIILVILDQESKRQEDTIVASTLRELITASQEYLGENYDDLRYKLAEAATLRADNLAVLTIDMRQLADAGYISDVAMDGDTVTNRFNQQYALLLRGVDSTSAGFPAPSMLSDDIGHPTEGDMEIESILVSYGGDPIPGQRGSPIVAKTGLFNAGFMVDAFEARGPLGNFSFTIGDSVNAGPYDLFAEYPGQGRFASLISLTDIGVIGFKYVDRTGDIISDAFRRCADIDRGAAPDEYAECRDAAGGQRVYSDIVMNVRTESGLSVPPAIRNLSNITCSDDMLRNSDPDSILIDCSTTEFTGTIEVGDFIIGGSELSIGGNRTISFDGADVTIEGDQVITREISGEDSELLLDGNPSQNLYDLVFNYENVFPGSEVSYPDSCASPEAFLSVESVADMFGRPVAGYRAYATEGPSSWDVGVFLFSTDNFCTTVVSGSPSPIVTENTANFNYRRVFVNGREFGFPIIMGGQRPGVRCVEFVDDDNNALSEGASYDEIFMVNSSGGPIDNPDLNARAAEIEARLDVVADEFVDIYDVAPGFGKVNMQIRCSG